MAAVLSRVYAVGELGQQSRLILFLARSMRSSSSGTGERRLDMTSLWGRDARV